MIISSKGKRGQIFTVAVGTLAKNAQYAELGEKRTSKTTFSLATDTYKEDGSKKSEWLSCECWYKLARYAAGLEKGDTVLVAGTLFLDNYWTERNKRDTYVMRCEFVSLQEELSDIDSFTELISAPSPAPEQTATADTKTDTIEQGEDLLF